MKLIIALLIISLSPVIHAKTQGVSIINATKQGMPMARKQRISPTSYIYTARAKKGFCFAVKGKKIAYMSKEMATKLKAKQFSLSHEARKFAALSK
jgi:hypothetical protein